VLRQATAVDTCEIGRHSPAGASATGDNERTLVLLLNSLRSLPHRWWVTIWVTTKSNEGRHRRTRMDRLDWSSPLDHQVGTRSWLPDTEEATGSSLRLILRRSGAYRAGGRHPVRSR